MAETDEAKIPEPPQIRHYSLINFKGCGWAFIGLAVALLCGGSAVLMHIADDWSQAAAGGACKIHRPFTLPNSNPIQPRIEGYTIRF